MDIVDGSTDEALEKEKRRLPPGHKKRLLANPIKPLKEEKKLFT